VWDGGGKKKSFFLKWVKIVFEKLIQKSFKHFPEYFILN